MTLSQPGCVLSTADSADALHGSADDMSDASNMSDLAGDADTDVELRSGDEDMGELAEVLCCVSGGGGGGYRYSLQLAGRGRHGMRSGLSSKR